MFATQRAGNAEPFAQPPPSGGSQGAPSKSKGDLEAGPNALEELLAAPPAAVADWLLRQVDTDVRSEKDPEMSGLLLVANGFRATTSSQREELVARVVKGFGYLPLARRVELLQCMAPCLTLFGAGSASAAVVAAARAAKAGEPSAKTLSLVSRCAQEAGLDEISTREAQALRRRIKDEAVNQGPLPLFDAVTMLSLDDRQQIADALLSGGLVPESRRKLLDDALVVGGFIDLATTILRIWAVYRWLWWLGILVPILEFSFGAFLEPCSQPITSWLQGDALLWLLPTLCILAADHFFRRALKQFLTEFFQEGPKGGRKSMMIAIVFAVSGIIILMIGELMSQIAFIMLLMVIKSCNTETVIVCGVFATIRLIALFGIIGLWAKIVPILRRFRERGESQPLSGKGPAEPQQGVETFGDARSRFASDMTTAADLPVHDAAAEQARQHRAGAFRNGLGSMPSYGTAP